MINPEFELEQIVYLKTDIERQQRMVTGYKVAKGYVSFELACGIVVSWHYGFEITTDKEFGILKPGFANGSKN